MPFVIDLTDDPVYQEGLEEGLEKGREEGRLKGIQECLQKGKLEATLEHALLMIQEYNIDKYEIS